MSEEIKVYTLAEVAEILQLTRRTIYTYVRTGRLRAVKLGKTWRVTPEAIRELLANGAAPIPRYKKKGSV